MVIVVGLYEILIIDFSNGCSSMDMVCVELIINIEIVFNIMVDNFDCVGDSNGSIILEVVDFMVIFFFV